MRQSNSLFFIIIFSFLQYTSQAQKGPFIELSAGYGFSAWGTSQYNATYTTSYYQSNAISNSKYDPLNVGQGFNPKFQFGYFLTPYFGFSLGAGYLSGTNYTNSVTFISNNVFTGGYGYLNYSQTNQIQSRITSLYFNPSLILKIPAGKFSPYLTTGLFLGFANSLTTNGNMGAGFYPAWTFTEVDNGGVISGLTASLGFEYLIKKQIGLFGELNLRYANYSPASYTTTANPGSSQSGNFTNNGESFSRQNEVNGTLWTSNSSRSIEYIPCNAIGLSIGLKYYLSKNQ